MSSMWKLDPESGLFYKQAKSKKKGPSPSHRAEYARRYRLRKYPDNEALRAKYREQQRAKLGFTGTPIRDPGPCEICGATTNGESRSTGHPLPMALDHDHTTGLFRGWLCSRCNIGIGFMRDDPAILAAAIRYLEANQTAHKISVEEV